MKRKCKYRVVPMAKGYAVTKSGRTVMRARDYRDACIMLVEWLKLDALPGNFRDKNQTIYA